MFCISVYLWVLDICLPAQIVMKLLAGGEGQPQTGVLTPVPCPHTLPPLLHEAGVTPVTYDLREDRGWAVDLDLLHWALNTTRGRCKPRAIYISNPGNPTGKQLLLLCDIINDQYINHKGRAGFNTTLKSEEVELSLKFWQNNSNNK